MYVSIAIVALNEESRLPDLLADILAQTYPHEKTEILLVDSMSEDTTRQIMERFARENREDFQRIQVLSNPGRTQSCGWNEALVHFSGEVIIRLDAHSHVPPEFVERNVENLEGEMVSGGVRPVLSESDSGFSRTLLMAEESMFGSSVSSFRRRGEKAYVKSFFHGAYRREVFEAVGGFREDLGRTEDNELHYRIREHGFRLCMSSDIISYQYIRPTFGGMCRQKYGNGCWVGLTAGVCPGCLSLYHFVPWAFVVGIVVTTASACLGFPWLAVFVWGLYGILAVTMAVFAVKGKKKSGFNILLPLMFLALHVSYGAGTVIGLARMPWFRKRHKTCDSIERVKEQMRHGKSDL